MPTVTDSLDRVVDAAQDVVADQIALLKADVSTATSSIARSGAMGLAGATLIVIGWMMGLVALYLALAPRAGAMNALLMLTALNLVPGVGLLLASRSRRTGTQDV